MDTFLKAELEGLCDELTKKTRQSLIFYCQLPCSCALLALISWAQVKDGHCAADAAG